MKEAPQPQLDRAFYGPPVPPQKSYYRPGPPGRSDCCCCSFLNCCFCCIFNFICQLLCALLLLVGIVALILWLIFRPNPVKFYVTDASLTQFDISSTHKTLHYNLALNMTVRNPNKRIGIYYDQIEAQALYQGQVFGTANVTGFYQGHKETDYLNPVFNGQNLVVLENDDLSKFDMEMELEHFSIGIKLDLTVRLKFLLFKTPKFSPKIDCDLKVPLDSEGKGSGYFETRRCHVHWRH
ncbi:Harpin inducing protein [Heracleum sosnowskyi]|uniref:Harpin inducing protein n=1 Tax=Heracleum sosnowskyi TaxID=360622 RepID=A0AAD8N601_9APIA|nr:Harpin inducing protein [Heracleum sosnowskyi]